MKHTLQEAWDQVQLDDAVEERIRQALTQSNGTFVYQPKRRLSITAIAAIVCMIVLSTAAVAAAIARINLDVHSVSVEESGETYIVEFVPTDADPIDLGDWYPTALQDEYDLYYVSSDETGMQLLAFSTQEDFILFAYGKANEERSFELRYVEEIIWCDIGQTQGCMFKRSAGEYDSQTVYLSQPERAITKTPYGTPDQMLFWTDEERGIGFALKYVGERDVDLVAIAESVEELEQPLERYDEIHANAAVVKLGNYQPQWLPEGFALSAVYGKSCSPLMNHDWYGYVHQVYEDEHHYQIHLYYEFIPFREESRIITGAYSQSSILIGDKDARILESADGAILGIVWEQTDEFGIPLTFTVKADNLTLEELVSFTESIYCAEKANTDSFDFRR